MPSPSSKWWINKQTTLDTDGFDGNIHVTQGAPSAWEHMLEKQRSHKNRPSEYIKLRMWRQSLGWPKLFTEKEVII